MGLEGQTEFSVGTSVKNIEGAAWLPSRAKKALVLERAAYSNGLCIVNQQHCDGHSSDRCYRLQLSPIPNEMIRPSVAAWVKEANDFSRVQVKTSNVRPPETVAMDTTEGEILKFCFASVLSRNDVIYLEGRWVKG